MRTHRLTCCGFVALGATLLVACGGGGGDAPASPSPGTPSTASFALAAGYKARIASGSTDNFNISGSCSGTATIATAAAVASTFEGVPGFAATQVSTTQFSNCSPASSTLTGTTYYNVDSMPIGLAIEGGEYARFASAPATLAATVKVGDGATISTMTTYTDSGKLIPTGQRVVSYAVEADSATTAIANLITRSYDLGNQVLATQQSRFRMAENGALTLLSIDVQFSTTSTLHLLYTPK